MKIFLQYPFYGQDLSNLRRVPSGTAQERHLDAVFELSGLAPGVNDGRYRYVVIASPRFPVPTGRAAAEELWTRSDPGVRLVIHETYPGARNRCSRYINLSAPTSVLDPARGGRANYP